MAAPVGVGGAVAASKSLLRGSGALLGKAGFRWGAWGGTAIGSDFAVVDLAVAAVWFAAVALHAQELNVWRLAAAAAWEGGYVIVLEAERAPAAFASAAVSGINDFFGRFRNVPRLPKALNAQEQKC